MSNQPSQLTPEEEQFFRALLWEETHLTRGPASLLAQEKGFSLIRALEPANQLTTNLRGDALAGLTEGPRPEAGWPWPGKAGREVLTLLWARATRALDSRTGTPGQEKSTAPIGGTS
jgi:hypothetical protein